MRDALAAGVGETGTTVHIATLEMDAGPVLAQAAGPRAPRRHRGDPARAHQRGRADALPRHHPLVRRPVGGDGGRMGQDHPRRLHHEGTAVRLRQDRAGRPGPRARRPGLGADLERRDLGRPGRGRHRPHRGGRPDRCPRDARAAGSRPSTPPSTAASWPTGRSPSTSPTWSARASASSTSWSATSTRSPSDPSIELIDVGGPTMVRAAAKNHAHVGIVVVARRLRPGARRAAGSDGSLSDGTRRRLARDAFAHTAAYDAAIVDWFDEREPSDRGTTARRRRRVDATAPCLLPDHPPDPRAGRVAALRREPPPARCPLPDRRAGTRGGTTWSSTGARSSRISTSSTPTRPGGWSTSWPTAGGDDRAVAIIKHANPCGAAAPPRPGRRPTSGPSSAIPSRRSEASWPSGARSPPEVAEAIAAGPQADRDHRPVLRRGGADPADLQAQGHPAAVGPRPRAAGPPVPGPRRQRARPGRRPVPGRPSPRGRWPPRPDPPRPSGGT